MHFGGYWVERDSGDSCVSVAPTGSSAVALFAAANTERQPTASPDQWQSKGGNSFGSDVNRVSRIPRELIAVKKSRQREGREEERKKKTGSYYYNTIHHHNSTGARETGEGKKKKTREKYEKIKKY